MQLFAVHFESNVLSDGKLFSCEDFVIFAINSKDAEDVVKEHLTKNGYDEFSPENASAYCITMDVVTIPPVRGVVDFSIEE